MFTRWGDLVFKLRFATIGVVVAALLALGGYGLGLEDHLSSSGWDDPTSESAQAARLSDEAYGRDHTSDVIVLYTAPQGTTIDDPVFSGKVIDSLNRLPKEHPDEIAKINGAYWATSTGPASPATFGSKDRTSTFASVAITGDNDTDLVRNFRKVKDAFEIPGVDVQVAGLQAVAGTLNDTMADDQKRMEILAIPAVAVLLFFIFGGVVAAALPLIVGGLTVVGAWGIVRFITLFTEVNSFVSPVVSMIGLGLAIDYGLFIVSRFREELAEGYDTRAAVRRSVMTAGRTVIFSATMIIASLGGMLLFPQGFLKSIAYGSIATVTLAALTAITVLPAMLSILGARVDMFGLKRFRKTKTAEDVENGFWGRSTRWVMQHPLKIAIPICIILLLLIIPVKNLAFGGINERYLPPDNATRLAQAEFDGIFPLRKSDPIQLVFISDNSSSVGKVWKEADKAPGLTGKFEVPKQSNSQKDVFRTEATLADSDDADPTIDYLRSIEIPDDVTMLVGGQPAIQKDSIDALLDRMPLMIALVLFVTTLLMFLTFGSLVLPIKAALMSALGLGSTLGILTWIFVDGHAAGLLNFTPQPIMSPVLVLIIAIIYGLSTDYEVFLLSRMVEARTQGASTTEAVRIGTAHTGRIITAAALILLVVTGAFAFSDLVMMQYIAYGMIAALFIDATILRMLLVPATMKLLGDDCWWAPTWMKKIQQKVGLGEPILDDERPGGGEVVDLVKTTPITDPVTMQMPVVADGGKLSRRPRRRPRTVEEIESEAPTQRLDKMPPAAPTPPPVTPAPAPLDPPRPRLAQSDRPRHAPFSALPHDPTGARPAPPSSFRHGTDEPRPTSLSSFPQDLIGLRPTPRPPTARETDDLPPMVPSAVSDDAADPPPTPPSSLAQDLYDERRAARSSAARSEDPPPTEPSAISFDSTEARPRSHASEPDDARRTSLSSLPQDPIGLRASSLANNRNDVRPTRPSPESDVDDLPPTEPSPALYNSTEPRPSSQSPRTHDVDHQPPIPDAPDPAEPRPIPSVALSFGTPRRPRKVAPSPASPESSDPQPTPAPEPAATPPPAESTDRPVRHAAQEPATPEPTDTTEGPDTNRNSIENWMAELRSSRRAGRPDEGRHSGGDGRTVSVNELLRRRDRD